MFCIIRASSQSQSPSTIIHLARNVDKRGGVLMLIILPNLKHSFISPVPVPVPDPDFLVFHTPLRSQIDIFHTQMDWSFLQLTLQNYLQLQCFPVHISYFLAELHVFWGYRSREKGNFTRPVVKILPHIFKIFPPESDDCNTSNRLYARLFGYNQNLLTSQERTMVITP